MYFSSKKLLTPANILLVNLAVSDLLVISMVKYRLHNDFNAYASAYVIKFLNAGPDFCVQQLSSRTSHWKDG